MNNPTTVQFAHRTLAFFVLAASFALWAWTFVPGFTKRQRIAAAHLAMGTLAQFMVGIITLVMVVPVGMATTHQVLACLLVGATVCLLHSSGPLRMGRVPA